MEDVTLDDVPDELVQAVLEALPAYYDASRCGAQTGKARMILSELPDGTHDVEVTGAQLDYKRVSVDRGPSHIR